MRMPTDKFYIETVGGLGNRMRALDSAIEFCNRYNKELHLIWPLFKGMNCRFDQLFEIPRCISSISYPNEYSSFKVISNLYVAGRKLARTTFPVRYDKFINKKEFWTLEKNRFDWSELSQYHRVRLQTDAKFFNRDKPYTELVPVDTLKRQIILYSERFTGKKIIGIHIRRTDNVWATESSLTESFIRKMDAELASDQKTVFFLATDSPAEESILIDRYGDKMLVHEKSTLRRDTIEGIQQALVDLYILSRVQKIIGSYRSSFTDTAAELGKVPLEIA